MSLQMILVSLIVLACALQAAWTLMPARARAATATALLRLHWPAGIAARLRKAAGGASGGCGGCDSCGPVKPDLPGAAKPITLHRRQGR